jgi:4-alpha-glucanotransferase
MTDLFERAGVLGIATEYRDGFGEMRKADPHVLARLLDALSDGDLAAERMLPRSVIVRGGGAAQIELSVAQRVPLHWEIFAQDKIAQGTGRSPRIELPENLPHGTLRLRVTVLGEHPRSQEASLIVCPRRAFQGHQSAPRRMWALAVQLYAVRSRRNWGHGDFSDLLALIDLAADLGAAGIGLNPLHALFDDRPEELSPYYPNSRLFLNPLYIDVDAIPEFSEHAKALLRDEIERLRGAGLLDYAAVASVKMRGLHTAYDRFRKSGSPQRRAAFDGFRQGHPFPLARFACFEYLRRKFSSPWWDWPQEWRQGDEAALFALRAREQASIGFFEFLQWTAHEQLERCRKRAAERGLPIGLYLDIAVGVRNDSFDAWCDQEAVLAGMAVGAPPDLLNTSGQNWGLAGFNPIGLENRRFEPFRRLLEASMHYAGAVRLDHVLGLQRLYLIPHGVPPSAGTYIRLPFDALLAITALMSAANECLVIGEDLGTIPENFRETLADWGIWSYQVMLFERSNDGAFAAPESYRENAVVTFGTHDTATFAGWRDYHDLTVKRTLQFDPRETDSERAGALNLLGEALQRRGMAAVEFSSVARYLADTPSRLLVISSEDLLGIKDQVNLPGTLHEHPNWRRRLPVCVEDLASRGGLQAIAEIMRAAGRSCLGKQ